MAHQRNVGDPLDLSSAQPTEAQADEGGNAVWRVKWFRSWRGPISAVLRGRPPDPPDPPDMDKLAQEVYLRLLNYSDDIAVENPQHYLFSIASKVANEWRQRSVDPEQQGETWLAELETGSVASPNQAVTARVRAMVRKLPDRERKILLMHVTDGKTYKQIAAELGMTHRIVLRYLARAYATLRMQGRRMGH